MSNTPKAILISLLLCSALTMPTFAASQHASGRASYLPHYVLFDVGSFGGGFSTLCYPNCRQLNQKGVAVGLDATSRHDPFDPLCFYDCHVDHAFEWKDGGTNDIGALKNGISSWALAVNDKDMSSGQSQNGQFDPDTGFWEWRAVIWKKGKARDLGTLGGTQSTGWTINNSGQAVVVSLTSDTNDPYIGVSQANCKWLPTTGPDCGGLDFGTNTLFLPLTTTVHGAVGSTTANLADLGTLGGPDSSALDINDAGQVVGWSYTSYDAGPSGVPDTHPFEWDPVNGMQDLGNALGGTFAAATLINQNGQIAGVANTSDDAEVHAVVWDAAHNLADCGTLGSDYGHPDWMNDSGDMVGYSRTADQLGRAFVCWHDNHEMIDLGTIGDDPESEATGINNKGMIIGTTFQRGVADLKGWVSNEGGPITDLNTLIRKSHGIHVFTGNTINDRGVIAAQGELANGQQHAVILVPEDDTGMIVQMNAAIRSRLSAHDSTQSGAARAARLDCTAPARMRPHYCTGG